MSLSQLLPKPKYSGSKKRKLPTVPHAVSAPSTSSAPSSSLAASAAAAAASTPRIPPYGHRQGFVPRSEADFGDGGAFPEVHVVQYPLGMGSAESAESSSSSLPVRVDAEGNVRYDLVLAQGATPGSHRFSQYRDLIEKEASAEDLQKPDAKAVEEATARTRAALEKKVSGKDKDESVDEPMFVRYTASNSGSEPAQQRIVRLHGVVNDPLEPPRFKHRRLPQAPPSPPAPVMHSPTRALTAEDRRDWKIPPCISNWKNNKGYIIPVDKRFVNDGRSMQETPLNPRFAQFAEALYVAEQVARSDIEKRAQMQSTIRRRQQEATENELREMAARAREQARLAASRRLEPETEEEMKERDERDEIRREKERELKREYRMEHMGADHRKKRRTTRSRLEDERDVSEQVALGKQVAPTQASQFDQRLFNQDQGVAHGFGADDSYSVYDKPLFADAAARSIYRPGRATSNADAAASNDQVASLLEKSRTRFKPDRGFDGSEDAVGREASSRAAPVQFERAGRVGGSDGQAAQADPFGMEQFLTSGKSSRRETLDGVGKRGFMSAAGGSTSGASLSTRHSGRRMEFQEAGEGGSPRGRKRKG